MHINQKISDFVGHCLHMNSIQHTLKSVTEVERKKGQLLAMEDILLQEIKMEEKYCESLETLVRSVTQVAKETLELRKQQI